MARKHYHQLFFLLSLYSLINAYFGDETAPFRRFEYKFSFKGPYLSQDDGLVPFWDHGGHAIPSQDKIRLAPSMTDKRGHMWSKKRAEFDGWEIELSFRVTGRGKIGADGFAMWFVEDKQPKAATTVFGAPDKWNGLGLIFDTYDNDGQNNNPIIMAIVNDKTKQYSHETDGEGQDIGHCIRDFRNRPFPVKVFIKYFKGMLSVSVNNGMSDKNSDYETCIPPTAATLPKQGYFGLSAATGGVSDDHDALSFIVHSLKDSSAKADKEATDKEREQYEKEFDEYNKKLEEAKEQYKKEHPDEDKRRSHDREEESREEQILQQIWQKQSEIHATVTAAMSKLTSIEHTQNILINKAALAPSGAPAGTAGGAAPSGDLSVITNEIQALKHVLEEIKSHSGGSSSNVLELKQLSHDLRDSINGIKDDTRQINSRTEQILIQKTVNQAPDCPSCISSTLFLGAITIQSLVVIAYMAYKHSKDSAAKKFY